MLLLWELSLASSLEFPLMSAGTPLMLLDHAAMASTPVPK